MRRVSLRFFRLSLFIAVIALFSIIANAQFRAGVQGTVTDVTGAVIPGATVVLTNKETGQTKQTVTSDAGFYRFSALPPGMYTLTVEQQSFKKRVVEDVKVDAESVRGFDVQLEAGGIAETVTVQADNAPLETEDASVRKTITNVEVQRLPQVGRDPYELVRLAPGVFGAGARSASGGSVGLPNTSGPGGSDISIFATENRPAISANGQRVSANNFQIDGVSVNSQTWGGAAVITPTQEAVKEVQVTSSSYSAEDGRNSGAQIKVVSQNGTNQFHGSAFFKYNDPGWNAHNSGFTIIDPNIRSANGLPRRVDVARRRVETRDKTFGGSLGGPIFRNKLFFFFAYEGLRARSNNPYEAFIETDQLRQFIANRGGISSQIVSAEGALPRVISIIPVPCSRFVFPRGNRCREVAGGLDLGSPPAGVRVGQYAPINDAMFYGDFDGIPDVQYALLENPSLTDGSQYVTRIDYEATQKDKFAFSLFYTPRFSSSVNTAAQSRPMADINSDRLNYNMAFTYIRTFTPTILNEARVNFTRWGYDEVEANPDTNFGIPRVEIEQFVPTNRINFGAPRGANTPGTIEEIQLNIRDVLTWIRGNHAFKFGIDYRQDKNENPGTGAARPIYTFVGPWNFANDAPIFYEVQASLTGEPLAGQAPFNTGGTAL
ncbi:MAG TPA: carboxypeptidase-like regulatory domain-containing protein, partial [Pyrinomonadaceae bacterium]|nr:carboxypeptidase-like regulatory domain-containing protein [Pyrinomonadaceae bacterium]